MNEPRFRNSLNAGVCLMHAMINYNLRELLLAYSPKPNKHTLPKGAVLCKPKWKADVLFR